VPGGSPAVIRAALRIAPPRAAIDPHRHQYYYFTSL